MTPLLAVALTLVGGGSAAVALGWRARYRVEGNGRRHVVTIWHDATKKCRICGNRSVRASDKPDRLCVRCVRCVEEA